MTRLVEQDFHEMVEQVPELRHVDCEHQFLVNSAHDHQDGSKEEELEVTKAEKRKL